MVGDAVGRRWPRCQKIAEFLHATRLADVAGDRAECMVHLARLLWRDDPRAEPTVEFTAWCAAVDGVLEQRGRAGRTDAGSDRATAGGVDLAGRQVPAPLAAR